MNVNVKLFAYLRKYLSQTSDREGKLIEVPENATISSLCSLLKIPLDLARLTLVNGRQVDLTCTLKPGDEVSIFPPLYGG